MKPITIDRARELIGGDPANGGKPISKATIYRMMQAARMQEQVDRGEIGVEDVPREIRRYLTMNFPKPINYSGRLTRLDEEKVLEWRDQQAA